MSDSKIQIKIGIVEFSGEGNQDWLARQLDKILEKVPELLKIGGVNLPKGLNEEGTANGNSNTMGEDRFSKLSVLNIAGKLNAKSGSELSIAAAAFIHFVLGKNSFSRDDITSNMKNATGMFKQSFIKNLSGSLSRLEKAGYLLKTGNNYSLSTSKVTELNALLSK